MAFDLLNFAYTVGTIDVAQDITPGVAQTGFRDFSSISASDTTYVVAVQGSKRAYMTVQKVGSILRPQTYHDGTNGEGATVTFDAGTITVFTDLGWQHIVHVDADGNAVNAEAVLNTFSPATLVALKTTPLPSSGETIVYLREISAGSKDGAFYVWDPTETATGDDFNYVVSSLSATGRWVRQKPIIEVPDLADDNASYNESLYGVSDDLRHKSSTGLVKKLPRVQNYDQGSYSTLALLKAEPSTAFFQGDRIELRGILAEGDIPAPVTGTWQASITNTDSLDNRFVRLNDTSGSNPGRFQFPSNIQEFSLRAQRIKTHFLVIDRDLLDPPASPSEGDHYLLPTSGTLLNGWSSLSNNAIAVYFGGAWNGVTPSEGDTVDILDEDITLRFGGSVWRFYSQSLRDGATIPDATPIPTVTHEGRYTLPSDGTTLNGFVGLNDQEWIEFIAGAVDVVLADGVDVSGTPGAIDLDLEGDADRTILSTDKAVYRLTRVGASARISGGSASTSEALDVDTFADLKALVGVDLTTGQRIRTKGYYAIGDGGHAVYFFTSGGTGSGNDQTVVDLTDASGHCDLLFGELGVDVRQIGLKPNERLLATAKVNAVAIETWAALENGIPLTDFRSDDGDVFWLAPPAPLTNGASLGQTVCVKLTTKLTINGSRSGAWFRQLDDQFCGLFGLYPGAEFHANNCRFDQWNIDKGDLSNANYSGAAVATDTTLTGTASNSVTSRFLGTIQGFGGDYYAFNCEYTNAVYGDIVPDARSRGNIMSSVFGRHYDTYSCLHALGNISLEYGSDSVATIYDRVVFDDNWLEEVLTEPVDIGGGILHLSMQRCRGKRCYTFAANPSHKEVGDIQGVEYVQLIGNDFDLGGDCGTLFRVKGAKNNGGVITGNTARNGLAGAVPVASFSNNGSGKLRVTTSSVHGGTTGEEWAIMGAETSAFSCAAAITVISTTVFDIASVDYTGDEVALRNEVRAVKVPDQYASYATGDFTVVSGVAFSGDVLQWAGSGGTIVAKQTANTALGSFDLGDNESVDPDGSKLFFAKVKVSGMTTGQLIVSIAGSGDYGAPDHSSDPITEDGEYTMLLASNGVNEIAYVGSGNFDGDVDINDTTMVEWQGAFLVISNCENFIVGDNEGIFFYDGIHSLDQGNSNNRYNIVRDNIIAGVLGNGIVASHKTNYNDLTTTDELNIYEGNILRDVYGACYDLQGLTNSDVRGGSCHRLNNGKNQINVRHGCEDLIFDDIRLHNGAEFFFDEELTQYTCYIGDNPGYLMRDTGVVNNYLLNLGTNNGKIIVPRRALGWIPPDIPTARAQLRVFGFLALPSGFTTGGNNARFIAHDWGNIEANVDVRFIFHDELLAVCLDGERVDFSWSIEAPRYFPL